MKQKYEENPWLVNELEDFLYFCCPECEERHQSKEIFLEHAFNQHPKAKDYLRHFKIKEEQIDDLKTEDYFTNENINSSDLKYPEFLNLKYEIIEEGNDHNSKISSNENDILSIQSTKITVEGENEIDKKEPKNNDKNVKKRKTKKRKKKTVKLEENFDEPINCEICDKIYANKYSLKRHINSDHSEKNYDCH